MIINCIDTGFKGLYTLINTINMSDFLIFKSECQAGKGVFMFKYNKDVIPTDCEPGVTRKILCYSDDLMMCEITLRKALRGTFISTNIYRLLILPREALNLQLVAKPRL